MSFATFALDIRELENDLKTMGAQAPVLMARALNRAGVAGKTAMVKAVVADTGIRQKEIEREVRLDKANVARPRVSVQIQGRRIPLIAFQARGPEPSKGRGRGVSYKLRGSRGRIGYAFIATMPGGHRGVYKRRGKGRLPIKELFGPSLPHVFAKFLPVFQERAQEAMVKTLRHEIDFARSKTAPPAAAA